MAELDLEWRLTHMDAPSPFFPFSTTVPRRMLNFCLTYTKSYHKHVKRHYLCVEKAYIYTAQIYIQGHWFNNFSSIVIGSVINLLCIESFLCCYFPKKFLAMLIPSGRLKLVKTKIHTFISIFPKQRQERIKTCPTKHPN